MISLLAVYLNYFKPQTILDPVFPRTSPLATITPSHTYLQDQAGGAFAMFAFLMIFMLRYTNELGLWKLFETALLFTDAAALWSMWRAVQVQGGVWRAEATANVGFLVVITIVRVLFVAGFGLEVRANKVAKKTA